MRDLVFDPILNRQAYATRSPIAKRLILGEMGKIEKAAVEHVMAVLAKEIEAIEKWGDLVVKNRELGTVDSLELSVSAPIQRELFKLWGDSWLVGEEHAIEAQVKQVPKRLKTDAVNFSQSKYATPRILQGIRKLLRTKPEGLQGTRAEQPVLRRIIDTTSRLVTDTTNRIKADFLDAMAQPREGIQPEARLFENLAKTLEATKSRVAAISRTETTEAYNAAALAVFEASELVTNLLFVAIIDDRTTNICLSRSGMIISANDYAAIASNTPPLHVNCRSVLSPLMPQVNQRHAQLIENSMRSPANRILEPLPKGWRS